VLEYKVKLLDFIKHLQVGYTAVHIVSNKGTSKLVAEVTHRSSSDGLMYFSRTSRSVSALENVNLCWVNRVGSDSTVGYGEAPGKDTFLD
jgi:hypothetical protein